MPKIWYTTDYYRGGLGDFLCGALGMYSVCRAQGYEFDIYLPADHPLGACFQVHTEKPNVAKQIIMNAELFDGAAVKRRLTKEMRGFPLKVVMVSTNVQDIATEDEMDDIVEDFMKLLRPSAALITEVGKLKESLALVGPYASIHVRCGDAHMTSATINARDNRITPAAAGPLVQRAADIIGLTMPVIVHTDSQALRRSIRCSDAVKVCNTLIQHTGEPIPFNIANSVKLTERPGEIAFLQTVAEFYLMCGATEIYYVVPSGFSRFSALFRGIYAIKIDQALIKAKEDVIKAAADAKAAAEAKAAADAEEEQENSFAPLDTPIVEPAPAAQQKKNKKK